MSHLPFILYDDQCTLCTRFKQSLEKLDLDKRIKFFSAHDDSIYEQYSFLDKSKCLEVVHLIDENLKIHQGAEVISYLLHHFPQVSGFSWLIDSQMGQKAIEIFYQKVNDYRKSKNESLHGDCNTCHKKQR